MQPSSDSICSACLLPPRQSNANGELNPLLRCSRCKLVWYHDINCQRKHFKVHRKDCYSHKSNNGDTTPTRIRNDGAEVQYVIEERPGKGRCMVALRTIPKSETIHPKKVFTQQHSYISSSSSSSGNNNHQYFQPLVPPVLLQSMRSSRCALCFGQLQERYMFQEGRQNPKYVVWLCSPKCRELGKSLWLAQEARLVESVCCQDNNHRDVENDDDKKMVPPPIRVILSSAIFAYRVCLGMARNAVIRSAVEDLQTSHESTTTLTSLPDDARAHGLATILTVKLLLQETNAELQTSGDTAPPIDIGETVIWDILGKYKINAFTICDGEFTPLGQGIYPIASHVNHSCQPNALQTFSYGAHQLPQLRLTACTTIHAQQEICISYIDHQSPRMLRQAALETYGFECSCPCCTDEQREDRLIGFKCQACGGKGRWNPASKTWRCETCQSPIPDKACQATRQFREISNNNNFVRSTNLKLLEQYRDNFRQYCFPSSWYYQTSIKYIVDNQLMLMGTQHELSSKIEIGHAALLLIDDLLKAQVVEEVEDWSVLVTALLKFRAAKLRIFLGTDIPRGMQEMKEVRNTLLLYYPPDHEIMEEVRNTVGS